MARPPRSTTAEAPASKAEPATGNGRSKRPRVSDVTENVASTTKASKRARSKTPANEQAAAADTNGEKAAPKGTKAPLIRRSRTSILLKAPPVPKNLVNALPGTFGILDVKTEWPLAGQVDPRKTEKPMSVFVAGNGDMGQLGLGTDATNELRRPKLHPWFEENSQPQAGESSASATAVDGENAGESEKQEDKQEQSNGRSEAVLGKLGIVDVACGGMHSLVVDSNGKIWTWGINDNGALGRITQNLGKDSDEFEYTPMLVTQLAEEGFKTMRVSASDSASLALSDKGQVRVWGSFRARDGLLGFDNNTKIQTLPVALPGMARLAVADIACGENHVLLLTCGGLVYSFGNGESGQLGRHSSARRRLNGLVPERIGGLADIVHIAAGDNHSFAVAKDGTVYGWGLNIHKQLGILDAEEEEGHVNTPIEIEALHSSQHNGSKVVQIGGGTFHTVFLFDNGEVFVCGGNDEHELGLADDHTAIQQKGENNYISPPVKLAFPASDLESGSATKIVKLAIGTRHSFALGKTGELYGWGLAGAEQLGCNAADEETVPTPKKVTGKTINEYRVVGMATGGQHSVIVAAKAEQAAAPAVAAKTNGSA